MNHILPPSSVARFASVLLVFVMSACGAGDGGRVDGGEQDGGPGDGGALTPDLRIDSGAIQGIEDGDLLVFRGIPYAEPPVGPLRFRAPVPVAPWSTPRGATAFGPPCSQRDHTNTLVGDEDCLTLNVWAPKAARASLRPVMVFIHGGAFIQGSANLAAYDGAALARTGDAVIITLQYRLGALGFLFTDALMAESPTDAGNQGLRDQQLALAWVQRNVAAFGGDPARVTIFGESAGGISVCTHLGLPSSDGLYARALIESGTGCYGLQRLRVATNIHVSALTQGTTLTSTAGCTLAPDALACLRALPAFSVVDAGLAAAKNGLGLADFGPVIDGTYLGEPPFDRVARGDRAAIPIVTGSNADEAKSFTLGLSLPTAAAYEAQVRVAFPLQADQVLALYPATDFATPKDAYNALLSDVAFICPALAFAQAAGDAGTEARAYHFTHRLSGLQASWGAFHALELWFVFGTLGTFPNYTPTATDQRVSEMMRRAWTDFARGDAPLPDLPWTGTSTAYPQVALLADPPSTATEIRAGRCTALQTLGLVRQ